MKIVFVSDTHLTHDKEHFPNVTFPEIPPGDMIIHAGDATFIGDIEQMQCFIEWYGSLPHKHKVYCAGNHEVGLERDPVVRQYALNLMAANGIDYVENSSIVVDGLKIYGSPCTPFFYDWAFVHKGEAIKPFWDAIPNDTDILVTHGPPLSVGDIVGRNGGLNVGCPYLLDAVRRVEPLIHVFGHVHGGRGVYKLPGLKTTFINAAICDEHYRPNNLPFSIELKFKWRSWEK